MRIGIYGGSFDPVHYGHLLLAETCREAGRLDQVWFVPTALAPHKQGSEPTLAQQRVDMLGLAIAGHEHFEISEIEIDRGGVSYTVDTLRHLHEDDSTRELFLLIGADSLVDLPTWRAPDEICRLATPLVVARPGAAQPDFTPLAEFVSPDRAEAMRQSVIEMPQIEISSTNLRHRVATGQSIRYQTPRAVEKYIEANGLYRGDVGQVPRT